jgi:hypothetical protein
MMTSQASTESLEVGEKSRGQKKTPYNTAHGAVTVATMSEKKLETGSLTRRATVQQCVDCVRCIAHWQAQG